MENSKNTRIDLKDSSVVVIIGSGAGGGTLAHELTRRGIKVALLEAGKRQSTETFSQVPGEAFVQLTWLDARTQSGSWGVARDFPALPVWHCKTVGGTTVHWTASTPRLQPWELRAKTSYGEVAGASLIDWPISYGELVKYYEIAERRMGVTRRNGVPGLPASNNFKVMYAGAKKLGYKQVHTGHMAINSRAFDGRGACIQQGFCVQGCKMGAKWSTLYTEIPRAEATGNLDLRSESTATKIEHGTDGRVNAVVYRDSQGAGAATEGARSCVWLAMPSKPRGLLLLSSSAKFPQGLGNSNGQVGRNYCHHITGFVWGIFDKPVYSLARCDAGRRCRRRSDQRAAARFRRRIPDGTARARSANFCAGGIALRMGHGTSHPSSRATGIWPGCSSMVRICRALTTASR